MSDTPDAETEDRPDAEPITVYSDYVCPFCYLGRRSLEAFQAGRETELQIDWRPFDLRSGKRNPDGTIDHDADDGKDDAYYEQAKQNVRRLQAQYGADEMELDLAIDVDSLPAQLVSVAIRDREGYETWLAFDEAVFAALWQEGRDIASADVLVDLATDVGVDADVVHDVLDDDERRTALREQFRAASQRGVTGVPTFVYKGHTARGAVPPEQLERLVEGV
ncbi:MAG: DsbA family protein [Halobellus sp.]|uniref:DsbA family protein n=1 Tax=Halobellus sp. TaxID=1979212 RepID=UPI0035D4B032